MVQVSLVVIGGTADEFSTLRSFLGNYWTVTADLLVSPVEGYGL
jgi:hypothetical protein